MKLKINQETLKTTLEKSASVVLAMFFIGLAMAFINRGNTGADPITTLVDGLSKSLRVSQGIATTIMNGTFLTFALFFNRKYIRGATLIAILTMGLFYDIALRILNKMIPEVLSFAGRLGLTAVGVLILGTAIGYYLSLDFGTTPSENVIIWLKNKLNIRYRYSAWMVHALCLLAGWLLGGMIGAGTIIALVLLGPIADYVMNKLMPEPAANQKVMIIPVKEEK